MTRFLFAVVALLPLALAGCGKPTQNDTQTLVDRATLTVQDLMNQSVSDDPQRALRSAKGVMVCPSLFKAGFFFGGEGGGCVMLGRAGNGTWSYPAFYGMGTGSFGLQIGIADSEVMMMIMTDKGLNAVLDSQFKLGVGAGLAIATYGAGVQGSTTAAVGADIVVFAYSRGLFGGISLDGSIMGSRTEWNQLYYGQPLAARQIVINMQGVNHGADPLREILTRYGAPGATAAGAAPVTPAPGGPGYAPAYPPAGSAAQPAYAPAAGAQSPAYAPAAAGQPPAYAPAGAPQPAATPAYNPATAGPATDRGPIQEQPLAPAR
ncbi:MAG: hypothetical protein BGO51_03900 [Rhodospirillales bacterium 69-11]|nr:MAG: hypothetical protein BGO51_03900 [Rhodospirillales bacterium 69-11]